MESITPFGIIQSVLPVYGLIILGGALRHTHRLLPGADSSLMKIVFHCFYPCLILDKVLTNSSAKDLTLLLWSLPVGFGIIALGLIIARLGGRLFKIPKGSDRNTFATTVGIQNYGFAAVPIVMALFPDDTLGVLFIHSLGVELALWTIGIATLQGFFPKDFKSLISPPILAVIIGLILNYTGVGDALASRSAFDSLFTLLRWLGSCSFPVALIMVGSNLRDELKHCVPSFKVATSSILIRAMILPALILTFVTLTPFPVELKQVLIVQAAMPSAVMPIVLAKFYNGKPAMACQVVICTQVIGILTIPFWISIGLMLNKGL